MYEIMIIEDDANVRKRLKSIIDWDRHSATLVCEAEDSETATELYMLYQPKIIITDINIPIISGLDLAAELQSEDPELQFIVITGYNDFNLVRQSVDVGAVGLLSKPVNAEEINNSIAKAITQLEAKRKTNASTIALQHIVSNNLPQLQEAFIANLLRKEPQVPGLVLEKINQLNIPLYGPKYTTALIAVRTASEDYHNKEIVLLLLRDTIRSLIAGTATSVYSYVNSDNRLVCIFNTSIEDPENYIESILIKSQDQLLQSRKAHLFAGIGGTVTSPNDLHLSYSGALSALKYQALLGDESITFYKNMEPLDTVSSTPVFDYLRKQFRLGQLSAIESFISQYISSWAALPHDEKEKTLRAFIFEYVTIITNEAIQAGIEISEMEDCAKLIMRLFQSGCTETWTQDVLELTSQLIDRIQKQHENNTNHLIRMAKEYIQKNLSDELLNLEQVSNHIGLSRIYFCKLFHQVEKISFTNYLKQARIEAAKNLLLTSNLKVFEISNAVGFSNPKYFSYVFKQTTGLTPGEFQKKGSRS